MSPAILKARYGTPAHDEAAAVFAALYNRVTGRTVPVITDDDRVSDLVVIGSDAVNPFLMREMLNLRPDSLNIRYGTDDYCLKTYTRDDGRRVLVLAGGRGRSTLYAVYGYFERFAGCRWFWDGDIVPHRDTLPMENIDLVESPRFDYRGLRYFAHRGLKRFQAEHWSLNDWKRELDWMTKKRLNFFMLRIGMDDVWQRAFPADVPYADGFFNATGPDAVGFDDRSDSWSQEYRGRLREEILAYARRLDLMYPTDCGTMTHWYSRTPESFLKSRRPSFLAQESGNYAEYDSGRVLDITEKENLDTYMHLTDTMVKEYEKSDALFHTIGLGERHMYKDPKKNMALKKLVYRQLSEELRRRYPQAKLMIASWDFMCSWTPEEVKEFLRELDPQQAIILDYCSTSRDPIGSFAAWDLVGGNIPWIFGLFHAYESESELRGSYTLADERLQAAAADPGCRGMVLWPELAHSDPLVLEYLADNAWAPLKKDARGVLDDFCHRRYGEWGDTLYRIWDNLFPFLEIDDWGGYQRHTPADPNAAAYYSPFYSHVDLWPRALLFLASPESDYSLLAAHYELKIAKALEQAATVSAQLRALADGPAQSDDPFIRRDSIDMARTALGRFMNYLIMRGKQIGSADPAAVAHMGECYRQLMTCMERLLRGVDDFSLCATLRQIADTAPLNPRFETVLKHNIHNFYCSQGAYELVRGLFFEEGRRAFALLADGATKADFGREKRAMEEVLMNTPLSQWQATDRADLCDTLRQSATALEAAAAALREHLPPKK